MASRIPRTVVFPHQTRGGQSNPQNGPNALTNMSSYWQVEHRHGSSQDSLVHLQAHKCTYSLIRLGGGFLLGEDTLEKMEENRTKTGDLNVDAFRIVVAHGPQYAAIATSKDWNLLESEYSLYLAKAEKFLRECNGDRDAAANKLIAWAIELKLRQMLRLTATSDEQADLRALMFDLQNIKSMTPVQLAGVERSHYRTWKRLGDIPTIEAQKACLMTWACAWEMNEIIRKFSSRLVEDDQWALDVFRAPPHPRAAPPTPTPTQRAAPPPPPVPRVSAKAPPLPARRPSSRALQTPVTSATPTTPASSPVQGNDDAASHPVLGGFFKMLKTGVPRAAVEREMAAQGLSAAFLDAPSSELPSYLEAQQARPRIVLEPALALKHVQATQPTMASRGANPMAGAFSQEMLDRLCTIRAHTKPEDDDSDASAEWDD